MDDYYCVTLLGQPNDTEADFKARLSAFWTHLLREHEEIFARVYAETAAFERVSERLSRKYLFEAGALTDLCEQLSGREMPFEPVDTDEVYSKFEAAPPEWFWIEH